MRIYLNSQGQTDYIFTDYKYDALYRVVQVKTPEGKQIYYTYDGYGRQKRKETPDNGQVNIKYNNDNSVRFSQDNYQFHRDEARPSRYYTFHGYDGQNRMVYSGEIHDLNGAQGFDNLDPMQNHCLKNFNEHPDNFLLVNVYDTIANARWQQYIYDYFGARYYDSSVSVWLSPDPLFEKHLQWSPYNYVLRNSFVLIDPDGKQIDVKDYLQNAPNAKTDIQNIITEFQFFTGYKFEFNENNNIIEKKEEISGQKYSETARERVDLYYQRMHYIHYSTTGCWGEFEGDRNDIGVDPVQIENFIKESHNVSKYAMGWAISLFHEVEHNELGKNDTHGEYGTMSEVDEKINDIRKEMDIDQRWSYKSKNGYLPFDLNTKDYLYKHNIPEEFMHYIKIY